MDDSLGLHRLADADLERLARALYKDQIATPLQLGGLVLAKLGHIEEHLTLLVGQSKTAALAIIGAVLNERRTRRGGQAGLLWAGPHGTGSGTREPHDALLELIATAERSVLWSGVDLQHDARLLRSLHAAQRGRELQVTLLLALPSAASYAAALAELAANVDQVFHASGQRPLLLVAAEDAVLAPLPRCLIVDDDKLALLGGAPVSVEPDERCITLGVVVTQEALARTLAQTWQRLIDQGVLVRLLPQG